MSNQLKSIYYPPGGILIWFLIILEIFTFLCAVLVFLYYRSNHLEAFNEAKQQLNPLLGTINTIILISSGFFIANSVHYLRANDHQKATFSTQLSLSLGIGFLIIKSSEFYSKINAGIGFSENTFYTFYWLMTGFHYVHVLFGIGLLFYMQQAIRNKKYHADNLFDVEASAVYWHLCDLIWILIFPILYLI